MTPRTFLRQSLLPLSTAVLCFLLPVTQTAYAANNVSLPDAPQAQTASAAPIPAVVLHAKKLFLTPPLWDKDFGSNTDDLTIRFTTEITDCCGYTIVSTPDQADVLVQLHGTATQRSYTVDGSTSLEEDLDLQMEFLDPTTSVPLWTVVSPAQSGSYAQTEAQRLQATLDVLVLKLKPLGTPSAVTTTATTLVATPKAPLPPDSEEATARTRLQTAHTVYLQADTADTTFPADPNLAFTTFTQYMTTWGRYTLAPSAQGADLVLQFQPVAAAGTPGTAGTPYFKLTLVDPATQAALWVITLPVQVGQNKQHVDLYAQSAQNVVTQLKLLAGQTITKQESAALTPQTSYGIRHIGLIFGLSLGVPALIATGVILAHQHKSSTKPAPYCPFPQQPTLCA